MQHGAYKVPVKFQARILCMSEPECHNEAGEGEDKMAHCVFGY